MVRIRKNILVKGFVQGVSYRKHTRDIATRYGVKGWIRNRDDGGVEACLEGEEHAVDALIAWCAFGPKRARVDEVQITNRQIRTSFSDFKILVRHYAAHPAAVSPKHHEQSGVTSEKNEWRRAT